MSKETVGTDIRRILVAVDASDPSIAALRAAADLAARLDAELLGLFVEDINLIRISQYSFATEVGHFTARVRQIDSQKMGRLLRITASRARKTLRLAARRAHVRWTFDTRRGEITTELRSAAAESDLVVLARQGWTGHARLGSTVRAILDDPPSRTLIVKHGVCVRPSLLVLFDGSESAFNALASAVGITYGGEFYLTIGVVAEDSDRARQIQSAASDWLRENDREAQFRWFIGLDGHSLREFIQAEEHMLVVPAGISQLTKVGLAELIDALDCPVMVVR